jgi:hypothetical protein
MEVNLNKEEIDILQKWMFHVFDRYGDDLKLEKEEKLYYKLVEWQKRITIQEK